MAPILTPTSHPLRKRQQIGGQMGKIRNYGGLLRVAGARCCNLVALACLLAACAAPSAPTDVLRVPSPAASIPPAVSCSKEIAFYSYGFQQLERDVNMRERPDDSSPPLLITLHKTDQVFEDEETANRTPTCGWALIHVKNFNGCWRTGWVHAYDLLTGTAESDAAARECRASLSHP